MTHHLKASIEVLDDTNPIAIDRDTYDHLFTEAPRDMLATTNNSVTGLLITCLKQQQFCEWVTTLATEQNRTTDDVLRSISRYLHAALRVR
jgi:hypothetical protein